MILIAITALLLASCNHSFNLKSIEGSGNVTTEKRNVQGDFKSVEVNNAIDLVIEQSDKTEIIVEADDNLQDEITTTVENGVLIIACDYNHFININTRKVTVKMPIIESLQASSSATIKNNNTLIGENIKIDASSGAEIDLNIESDALYCDSSSGSTVKLYGKALKLEISASSGSEINARDLLANEVIADASSGSSISVRPIVSLNADASSGASINYKNAPKSSIQKNANSGGSINQE